MFISEAQMFNSSFPTLQTDVPYLSPVLINISAHFAQKLIQGFLNIVPSPFPSPPLSSIGPGYTGVTAKSLGDVHPYSPLKQIFSCEERDQVKVGPGNPELIQLINALWSFY